MLIKLNLIMKNMKSIAKQASAFLLLEWRFVAVHTCFSNKTTHPM